MGCLDAFYRRARKIRIIANFFQLILIIGAIAVGVMFMIDKSLPKSRNTMMILGYGAKSLIILAYEFLSEHARPLQRFGSVKAYAILNIMEVVFWAAGFVLMFMMILRNNLKGYGFYMVGAAAGISVMLSQLFVVTSMIFVHTWRHPEKSIPIEDSDDETVQLRSYRMG